MFRGSRDRHVTRADGVYRGKGDNPCKGAGAAMIGRLPAPPNKYPHPTRQATPAITRSNAQPFVVVLVWDSGVSIDYPVRAC